jgi:hypothetical protein
MDNDTINDGRVPGRPPARPPSKTPRKDGGHLQDMHRLSSCRLPPMSPSDSVARHVSDEHSIFVAMAH